MEQIAKQFTLIDLLGFFTPGAIMTLATNVYIGDLTEPFDKFFGENALMLAVYFLTLSYLFGTVLHQVGSLFDWIIWRSGKKRVQKVHEEYSQRQMVRDRYTACFGVEFPEDSVKAGQEIFRYVQHRERPPRIIIFNAFYTMSRTLVVALTGVILMMLFSKDKTDGLSAWLLPIAAMIPIFWSRWVRFERKCVEEAYMLFIAGKPQKPRD